MRVLVTGASGFVGNHFADCLHKVRDHSFEFLGTGKEAGQSSGFGAIAELDITDRAAVSAAIRNFDPTHVVHLAGIAAPAAASADPQAAWQVNVHGTLNVAYAILEAVPECWLINIGSGLIYGESAKSGLPLDEKTLLAPIDEYGVTKAASDLAIGALTKRGLKCIRVRPFNHTGIGQSESFVVPAFAAQIARIEAGALPPVIRVGNLDAQRDFLDVRDVAEAYMQIVQRADGLESGSIFNVGSGISYRLSTILDYLLALSEVKISVEQDVNRLRPSDLPVIIGDATRLRNAVGWYPRFSMDDTLITVLNDWRARVAK